MYIHLFAFQWTHAASANDKVRARAEILKMQGQIAGLLETHVGTNASPRGHGFTFGGVMKFEDKPAFEAYDQHQAHQALLEWLRPLIDPLEVDFESE